MPAFVAFDPLRLLQTLTEHKVEFVVIGGFAAWALGVPVVTSDVDIIYAQTPDNVERLLGALQARSAIYRDPMGRTIEPDLQKLGSTQGGGHHLLQTDSGDLDVLRESSGFDYARLEREAIWLEVEDLRICFAPLHLLIEMKSIANRPKDRAVLPLLQSALDDEKR